MRHGSVRHAKPLLHHSDGIDWNIVPIFVPIVVEGVEAAKVEQRVPSQLIPLIKNVVHQLVIGNYAGLIADGRADDWTEETLRDTIARITGAYGHLVDLPDEAFDRKVALPLNDGGWGIDIHLWTVNGISAYTLVVDIYDRPDDPIVHIEDIEVM